MAATAAIRSLTMPNRKSSSWAAMFLAVSAASSAGEQSAGDVLEADDRKAEEQIGGRRQPLPGL